MENNKMSLAIVLIAIAVFFFIISSDEKSRLEEKIDDLKEANDNLDTQVYYLEKEIKDLEGNQPQRNIEGYTSPQKAPIHSYNIHLISGPGSYKVFLRTAEDGSWPIYLNETGEYLLTGDFSKGVKKVTITDFKLSQTEAVTFGENEDIQINLSDFTSLFYGS